MRLEAVGKRYGLNQRWVIRGFSADVAGGQLIRLEGRNGSGKSTLLSIAAGVCVPTRGSVSGRPPTGYVPERFPGGLSFSARDYLLHLGRIHGVRAPAAAADEWLDRLGAADYARAPLRTLSKGMCQKVAIAQALLPRPGLLVLDEAWTGLDQAARATLDAAVGERVAQGGTVMFVDHQQDRLAAQVSQRWLLGHGPVRVVLGPGPVLEGKVPAGTVPAGTGQAGMAAGTVAWPGRGQVVGIELAGVEPESVRALAGVPGLADLTRPAGDAGQGRILVTVAAGESDALLRLVLSWDGVRVIAVWPAAGP
ncbi:MAG TPA: ATP-binding cassette domain-containing protein [Streptosporangiaceae bacterium]|nr:ATP-binding cassette domain-containing protein [Streptosporangiaceae bacterium]